ncbi:MAG: methylmalonyl-CoA mutase small subunit [Marinilabiliaceae bacterium]|nr:methylmalonyl-CoA mutase small subunit [Marinilabiliaceae bacterium]
MADTTNQPLFSEFPPVSTQEWMDKITADLKGADFEKKLVWKTSEGFNVRPFYRSEDLENLNYLNNLPGEFPYVRGTRTDNKWFVRQDINVCDAENANKKAIDVLMKGVDSLGFKFYGDEDVTSDNIEKLLNGIKTEAVELNFETKKGNKKLLEGLASFLKKNNNKVQGSLVFDPIGKYTITGKTCSSVDAMFNYTKEVIETAKGLSNFKSLAVNAKNFNNAGSTIVQELAFALAIGSEYLSKLNEKGLTVDEVAGTIKFNFGIGGNYFMEIAKLRAARLLWANIVKAYNPANIDVCKMQIHCETSTWNKTIFDSNVNMLRTQTEAMSATIGGTNSLTVIPFDKIYKNTTPVSERVARNQQLLLKEESHFEKIVDASAGSYYIENITDSIAKEAWSLFVEVEKKGGYIAALETGFIQAKVKESANARRKAIASRRENLLGTNQFPNFSEQMQAQIDEKCLSGNKADTTSATIEPIELFRGAEEFEALRLATEKAAKRPKAFMLTYGNLAMRLARSQFSCNFFACAGYEVIDNNGFKTVEEGIEAAKKAGAEIVVLCSSDDEYAEAGPAAYKALGNNGTLVIAGAPACADDLKKAGIEHFINVKSNVLETLTSFSKALGII